MMEVADIEGLTEADRRSVGVNLSGGFVNSAEICRTLYKTPTLEELGGLMAEELAQETATA
jgi:hypothetical protein